MLNLPDGGNVSNISIDLLDTMKEDVPTLGLTWNVWGKISRLQLSIIVLVPGVGADICITSFIDPSIYSFYFPVSACVHAPVIRYSICLSTFAKDI